MARGQRHSRRAAWDCAARSLRRPGCSTRPRSRLRALCCARRASRRCRSGSTSSSRRCCSSCRSWASRVRDGQQVMLDAREIKSYDEILLLSTSAALVDGAYQDIVEALKPGVKENQIVALATKKLYELGSDDVESINAVSGERCNPHPHNFSDRIIRPGDQAFFDIMSAFNGYRTCYYRTFSVGFATPAQKRRLQAVPRVDRRLDRLDPAGRDDRRRRARVAQSRRVRLHRARWKPSACSSVTASACVARAAGDLAPELARAPDGDQGRHGVCAGDLLPGARRLLGGAHRGRDRRDRRPARSIITRFPAQELFIANAYDYGGQPR